MKSMFVHSAWITLVFAVTASILLSPVPESAAQGNGVPEGITVQPEDGSTISEARPFVIIEFPEMSTVSLNSVLIGGDEVADQFEQVGANQFVFWPLCLVQGIHRIAVDASDMAGNRWEFNFGFETTMRCDFQLPIAPGFHLVSLPADPLDPAINAVFTEPSIETVITLDSSVTTAPWSVAVRRGDRWETPNEGRPLTEIRQGKGYWVETSEFASQTIPLHKFGTRPEAERLLPKTQGWNLVGVVDLAGNQTQDNHGDVLKDQAGNPVSAQGYLGEYTSAFIWDPIAMRLELLAYDDPLIIGVGVWVLYGPVSDANQLSLPGPFTFDSGQRSNFELDLAAGWNAISLPANPLDPAIDAVFTERSIETVITWDPSVTTTPWSVAVHKGDRGWGSLAQFGSLTVISQSKGYWVEASESVRQPIALHKYGALPVVDMLPPAMEGWRFVGVVDYAGNQTQNHFGEVLNNQAGEPVSAQEYLGEYTWAFTWDPISMRFEPLVPDAPMIIGDGVWVYSELAMP